MFNVRGEIKRNATDNTYERSERKNLITIYKLMNNFEETDKKGSNIEIKRGDRKFEMKKL